MPVVGVSRALSNSPQGWLLPCCAGSCCSTRSHAADKKKAPQTSWRASFLCRWWGSNPHVLLAQGILSFYPHLPSGVIQWYLVISGSHCAKAKFTPQRVIIWNIHDFSMRFPPYSVFSVWTAQMEIGGMFKRDAGQNAPLLRHKTKGKSRIMNQNQAKEYYKKLFVNYPDVLSVEEATTLLVFKSQTAIIRRIHQHRIRCLKVGRSFMIPKEYLIDYLLDS